MRTQQEEVYAGEAVVRKGDRFASQADIQVWVDQLVEQPWWPERFPEVMAIEVPIVKRRAGTGSVGGLEPDGIGVIEMAECHWDQLHVLHELAHVCAEAEGSTSHDPTFVRIYLELVFRVLGTAHWQELRTSLLNYGVIIDERDDV